MEQSDSRNYVVIPIEGNGARPSHFGNGYRDGGAMYSLNTTEVHAVAYGISAFDSNSMKSSNPHSGIYEADTSRTLDLNGGNPACNQGGILIVEKRCLPYQDKVGALCGTDHKWIQQQQVMQGKLIVEIKE